MKIVIDSKVLKKVSKQLNNHLKTLKHQPLELNLSASEEDAEMVIKSEESRLRIDFKTEPQKSIPPWHMIDRIIFLEKP